MHASRTDDRAAGQRLFVEKASAQRRAGDIDVAEHDERINASWPDFEAALRAASIRYERHLYPGTQHGFHNDTTPRYDEQAAREAWHRTLALFDRTLRSHP